MYMYVPCTYAWICVYMYMYVYYTFLYMRTGGSAGRVHSDICGDVAIHLRGVWLEDLHSSRLQL